MVNILEKIDEKELRPGSYSVYSLDCLTLHDKLLYYSGKAPLEIIQKIENHTLICSSCYQDLYGPEETLRKLAIKFEKEL